MTHLHRILPNDAAVAFLVTRQFALQYDLRTGIFLARNEEAKVTMPGRSPTDCVHELIKNGYTTALAVEAFLQGYTARTDTSDAPDTTDPTTEPPLHL